MAPRLQYKQTRIYNTRLNKKKRMSDVEQDNQRLRDELAALKEEMKTMTAQMKELMILKTPPPPPPTPTQAQSTVISLVSTAPVSTPQYTMPEGYPWSVHVNQSEGSRPHISEIPFSATQQAIPIFQPGVTFPQVTAAATYSTPIIHVPPYQEEPIYHGDSVGGYDRVDDLQDKINEMQREMRALRGKELFGRDVHDLCLVPNIQLPPKFKVPEFVKYKGNTCPQTHLVMYARKMSAYSNNHDLLVHYFQESLADAALQWYVNLDNTKIRTFSDLAEAFVQQYKYNLDLAPDRDQLRAMGQKEKESFKEYAQRWRAVAAQITPPPEEKELTKIFLKPLDSFYYERMVDSAPSDFTEMVNMGVRLEEAVREGRLVKEGASASNMRKFGNNFGKKKEQEVGMVAHGRPQQWYSGNQHVAAIQNTGYQPQFQQRPQPPYQQPYQQRHQQPRQQASQQNRGQGAIRFDPIPMKYAELLPALLDKNLVQTRAPPPVPERLPAGYRADLSCAFHQGAPGHDIEDCYALRTVVQRLIEANYLSFKESNPNA